MILLLVFLSSVKATEDVHTIFSNYSPVRVQAKPITKDNVSFLLFTRNNPNFHKILSLKDSSNLKNSHFDVNQTTKIIIHGWVSSNHTSLAIENLKNAYIHSTDFNVIIVDWSKLAEAEYKVAKSFVMIVSSVLIRFFETLMKNGASINKLHLIGHCLGAHIAGITGRYFKEKNKMVDFIVGLDPAYPLYKFSSEDQLLDKTDARHVEVVHSSSGYWGYRTPMGHVDYYPNGGQNQPGCYDSRGLCAHYRAVDYYAHSITSATPFTAILWESYERVYYFNERSVNMSGLHFNVSLKGTFYFKTHSAPPYALGGIENWAHEIKDIDTVLDTPRIVLPVVPYY